MNEDQVNEIGAILETLASTACFYAENGKRPEAICLAYLADLARDKLYDMAGF